MEEIVKQILEKYPSYKKESLIPILQDLTKQTDGLSEERLQSVSSYLGIPLNKTYGILTFYDQFRLPAKGKYHFQVCNGTSCHLNESSGLLSRIEELLQLKAGSISRDKRFSLEAVSCLGACAQGPVISVNGVFHTHVSREFLSKIVGQLKETKENRSVKTKSL